MGREHGLSYFRKKISLHVAFRSLFAELYARRLRTKKTAYKLARRYSYGDILAGSAIRLAPAGESTGFAAGAILTLAVGIGASTSIFSVTEAMLLRPLPYSKPDQIVRIWEQAPIGRRMNLAEPNFDDFRGQSKTLATLARYQSRLSSVSGSSEPMRLNVAKVSEGFFRTLGVEPFRGRLFASERQGVPEAIVSYGYWEKYLGASSDLSKLHLGLDGAVYPVIGVMPAGFDIPSDAAVWISSERDARLLSRSAHNWQCIGRIRDGITLAQARADLTVIARRIRNQYGSEVDLNDVAVVPLADALVGDVRTALLMLLGAVGLLLLVACANVAGLLLARISVRQKELALRVALGSGRARLIQQFLAESVVLSLPGGMLVDRVASRLSP